MIKYSCEFSVSLDNAHKELKAIGAKFKVLNETTLGFRKKPTFNAKVILTRHGFIAEAPPKADPADIDQLTKLKDKFS